LGFPGLDTASYPGFAYVTGPFSQSFTLDPGTSTGGTYTVCAYLSYGGEFGQTYATAQTTAVLPPTTATAPTPPPPPAASGVVNLRASPSTVPDHGKARISLSGSIRRQLGWRADDDRGAPRTDRGTA
jgi:hypothetical protein